MFKKMSFLTLFKHYREIKKCRNCGSKKVGKGEGTFTITENYMERTCKCGASLKSAIAKTEK